MENFKGIFICSTNLTEKLDAASFRRFTCKVKFDFLKSEGKQIFFDNLIASVTGVKLTKSEKETLDRIRNLAPGAFKAGRQQLLLSRAQSKSNSEGLRILLRESEGKRFAPRGRIGF